MNCVLTCRMPSRAFPARWSTASTCSTPAPLPAWSSIFQVLLTGIVADPTCRLAELPLISDAERHTLLNTWNQTQSPFPDDLCIHQLFEAQAQRTPDATALIWQDQRLTLWRVEPPGDPPGPSPDFPEGRPRSARRHLHEPLRRHGGWPCWGF